MSSASAPTTTLSTLLLYNTDRLAMPPTLSISLEQLLDSQKQQLALLVQAQVEQEVQSRDAEAYERGRQAGRREMLNEVEAKLAAGLPIENEGEEEELEGGNISDDSEELSSDDDGKAIDSEDGKPEPPLQPKINRGPYGKEEEPVKKLVHKPEGSWEYRSGHLVWVPTQQADEEVEEERGENVDM